MLANEITNVSARWGEYAADYTISCEHGGFRYHVWVAKGTGEVRPTLFKNSLFNRGEEGYFETRRLRTDSKFAAELIPLMQRIAVEQNLIEQAKDKAAEGEETRLKTLKAIQAINRKKEAAADLYDALVMILPLAEAYLKCAPSHPDNALLETARAAIVKADKGGE